MSYRNWTNQQMPFNPILKPYEKRIIQILEQEYPDAESSKFVYDAVNETNSVSRATVINFLELLRKRNLIAAESTTGKGGMRYLYRLKEKQTAETVICNMAKSMVNLIMNAEPYLVIRITTR